MNQDKGRSFFYLILALSMAVMFIFLKAYLEVIIISVLLSIFYYPLYAKILRRFGRFHALALIATMLLILATLFIPIALAGTLIFFSTRDIIAQTHISSYSHTLSIQTIVDWTNVFMSNNLGLNFTLSADEISTKLKDFAVQLSSILFGNIRDITFNIVGLVPLGFILIYTLGAVLANYDKIRQYLHNISPFNEEINHLYIGRVKSIVYSMVKGTFVVALVQGIITGIFLFITGVPYVLPLSILVMLVSVIPLGAGIVIVPISIFLILTGSIWQGIILLTSQLFVVSNIDNILRPRLVDKKANLHPALVLIGIIAGISHFGFMGIIYGPVLMIFFVTTIEVYLKYFKIKE
ncbi:MAG: AI-2E family transporter [bacterium]